MVDEDFTKSDTVNPTFLRFIVEEIEKNDYPQFRYLMSFLPLVLNAHVIVETGLGTGHSSRIHLEALSYLSDKASRVLHTFEYNIQGEGQRKAMEEIKLFSKHLGVQWNLHVEDSTQGSWSEGVIDILYLDADHSYENVSKEINRFGPYVSRKGIIYTHDSWPGNPSDPHPSATFHALNDWGKMNGWKSVLFKTPEGMTFLYRENL